MVLWPTLRTWSVTFRPEHHLVCMHLKLDVSRLSHRNAQSIRRLEQKTLYVQIGIYDHLILSVMLQLRDYHSTSVGDTKFDTICGNSSSEGSERPRVVRRVISILNADTPAQTRCQCIPVSARVARPSSCDPPDGCQRRNYVETVSNH